MGIVLRYAILYVLAVGVGTIILIVSMFIASWVHSGIDFGTPRSVIPKVFLLLVVVEALQLLLSGIPYGSLLVLLIYFGGLMKLFDLDVLEAITLALVNWALHVALFAFLTGVLLVKAVEG